MVPYEKLEQIVQRYEFLEAKLSSGDFNDEIAELSREYAQLKPVVAEIRDYKTLLDDLAEAEAMLADPDMKELAEEELPELKAQLPEMEHRMRLALLPRDAADDRPAIIEIRPGTGGDEAGLFAGDLLRMYQRYAESHGWKFEILEMAQTELGGIKEVVANVKGEGVFARLKFESGVHRVQRVPETESGGRIHTSAATVAVLPEAEDVDIEINANDLRIDTMRSSGAGGQHVNTTDSAVRITHHPTGIVVTSSEKSQHQNRDIAMKALKSRLYQMELDKRNAAINEAHENKGSAGWGNQIRSYVLQPYQMVKDLRTQHETSDTQGVLDGDLDGFMAATLAMQVSGKSRADAQGED
ncbi:peptide chain release factor 1 [Pararhodobacter marinus]|uniref:peptide chain release factor 1 n=1 Tax=Pararhodobacter marinus TaxID=2184063 RepID=UPI003515CB5F